MIEAEFRELIDLRRTQEVDAARILDDNIGIRPPHVHRVGGQIIHHHDDGTLIARCWHVNARS